MVLWYNRLNILFMAPGDVAKPGSGDLVGATPAASGEKAGEVKDIRQKTIASLAALREPLPSPEKVKEILADREKLRQSSIKDIRFNTRFLVKKGAKGEKKAPSPELITDLKTETERRIKAYTSAHDKKEGWYTIDYNSVGGIVQEMNVGLGDIILNPAVDEVEVQREGKIILAKRGIVRAGEHKGRVGFLDQNGNYVATFTGDKFRILKDIDIKGKDGLALCLSRLGEENAAREEEEKTFMERREEDRMFNADNFASSHDGLLKENVDVVSQIKDKLNPVQREMAKIIEEEFKAAGVHPSIIAAAIFNAWSESRLSPAIQSWVGGGQEFEGKGGSANREDSWGLFQVNIPARTKKLSADIREARASELRQRMQNPRENCREILREVTGGQGARLRSLAASGASVPQLTAVFAYDIERPARREQAANERAFGATKFFNLEKPEGQITYIRRKGGNIPELIKIGKDQKRWVFGSSIGVGFGLAIGEDKEGLTTNKDTGVIGLGGYDAGRAFRRLTLDIWPEVEARKINPPKEVVLLGFAINGLAGHSAQQEVEDTMRIVSFLEGKGIRVKIAKVHSCNEDIPVNTWNKELKKYEVTGRINILDRVNQFNETIRKQYPGNFMDTGTADSSAIHPGSEYYLKINRQLEDSARVA